MDDVTPRGSESTPTSTEASPGSLFKVPMPMPMPTPQEFARESSCGRCHKMFTLLRRRHHCRGCHVAICNSCGRKAVDHRRGDNVKPQWYCCKCVDREEEIEAVGFRVPQLSKKSSSHTLHAPPQVLTVPKFCIECGYELPPRVKFCIQCGTSVRPAMTSPQATERVPTSADDAVSPKDRDQLDSTTDAATSSSKSDEAGEEEADDQEEAAQQGVAVSELESQVASKNHEVAKLQDENSELKKQIEQLKQSLAQEKARSKSVTEPPPAQSPQQEPEQMAQHANTSAAAAGGVKAKDHPDYLKFFKLLSMGLPPEQVKMKMQQAGVDPAILDDPDAVIGGSANGQDIGTASAAPTGGKTVKDDERYAKFFKLLKMGMPPPQIKLKMSAEGLDPDLLDTPDAPIDGGGAASSKSLVVKVSEDPAFEKFFKLVKMGLPSEQVKLKMKAEGLDPSLLDQPDAPSPNQASGSAGGSSASGGLLGGLPPKVDAVKVDDAVLKASLASKLQLGKQSSKVKVEEPQLPKKEVIKPQVELRPLFWNRVPVNVVSSTVWMKLSDSNASFDVSEMEWMFRKNAVDESKQKRRESVSEAKEAAPQQVLLLDPKRQQNAGIAIARLRMPASEIKSAIYALDESRMGSEMLNVLISIAPTMEEQDLLKNYNGDEKLLGNVEKFFLEMLSIPRFGQRIKCFRFKMQFETRILETQAQLDTLVAATEQVSDSEKLRKVLEHILALGNYLNGNTPRGGAYGFKLDTLTKLHTLKSVEPRLTLMHFLLRQLEERNPEVIAFAGELPHISDAKRLSLDQLRSDINAYNSELAMLQGQVRASKADQIAEDRFYDIMSPFASDAAEVLDEMSKDFSALQTSYNELVGSFGEDPRTVGPIEFFTIMEEFVNEFKKAYRQNQTKEFQTIWNNMSQARIEAEAAAKAKAEAEAERKREEDAEAKAKAESLNPDEAKQVYGQVIAIIQNRAKKRGEDYGSAIDQFKLTSRRFGVDEITAEEFCESVRRIVGTKTALKIIPDSAKLLANVSKRKDLLIAYDKFASQAKLEKEEQLQKKAQETQQNGAAKVPPKRAKMNSIKVQDIEPVVGEAAQQLHRSILDSVQQAFNNDMKKMKTFTSNARKYGSEQITAREFYQYLTASFDPDFVARLVPDLARLLQDAEKRHALLRALCESAPGWEKFSGL